ncbi:MAG: methyltransferase domain-containing protein [Saprospiraceae bacterium]
MNTISEQNYWSTRYENQNTGWDIGYPSIPIKEYFDQIEDKNLRILIPGAGNAYEAEYLHQQGFMNVFVMDIVRQPLEQFAKRVPTFPKEHLIQTNFFEHEGEYDIIVEQTFFCSFPPLLESRQAYAKQVANLLVKGGKLVGLWFSFPLKGDLVRRPFGGSKDEYISYFEPYFDIRILELCYNSIKPRQGNELFGLMMKV